MRHHSYSSFYLSVLCFASRHTFPSNLLAERPIDARLIRDLFSKVSELDLLEYKALVRTSFSSEGASLEMPSASKKGKKTVASVKSLETLSAPTIPLIFISHDSRDADFEVIPFI